ncbi:class I SAM-dependent methyltransferase [Pseudonocardia asaccharolytica]|uniref:Transcriptional regulator n=1 Tax=Pseudonocardia asaccharolytica DSM 44247 = NBRC 16224 TaxID=1123024 RepID=A0A511DAS4_9PSEU|nr:class I SAM-dependent methyltransferase [Pseudonocardia asaccharolytica]GEL20764.1 transcriptional regulator [Pseudonocardia asaccharolytica DSM 44247 = NBRC 16224]
MTTTDIAPRTSIDPAAAEEFAGRVLTIFDNAAAALMISIGHQTGLFDTLTGLRPATSRDVADAAGLDERYVREWLKAMTTARVVGYDPEAQTYRLPTEHAVSLSRASGPKNLAVLTTFISMLGEVEPAIVECFRTGGGLPYSAYPRFHETMAGVSGAAVDGALLDVLLPLAPGLVDRLRRGIDVLDVGCGRGHAVNLMAGAFPASRFIGYDFSEEAIGWARDEAAELGLTNAGFEVVDVARMRDSGRYDLVTAFDAIHDQADPAGALAAAFRALRSGGTFLAGDVKASSNLEDNLGIPWGTYIYTVSTMHCMSVSLGLDGAGLGTGWGHQLASSMLAGAGFTDVKVNEVEAEPFNLYYVARKP